MDKAFALIVGLLLLWWLVIRPAPPPAPAGGGAGPAPMAAPTGPPAGSGPQTSRWRPAPSLTPSPPQHSIADIKAVCARHQCELIGSKTTGDIVEFTMKARSRSDFHNVMDELITSKIIVDFFHDPKDWKYWRAHEPAGFFHYVTYKVRVW